MVIIAKRTIDPKLQTLYREKKPVYSISKANCINECEYEAYRTYILKDRGKDGIYGILGTKVHNKIEEIITGKACPSELLPTLTAELEDLDLLGIDFPKDRYGGTSIRDNWIADMIHFCKNFVMPKGDLKTEELFIYKVNENRYFQGYIDLIKYNKDNTISIFDWKTSTYFKKDDLIHHGRQLVLYAMGKEQEGHIVKEVAWIMVKYCEVDFNGRIRGNSKTKTPMTKVVNRGKLIKELKAYIEDDLYELGFDTVSVELMVNKALEDNSFDLFPDELKTRYQIKPCVLYFDLTDEARAETLEYINQMADLFESKSDNEKEWKPRKFYKTNKTGKESEDVFKCLVLCNHKDSCIHIKRHQETKGAFETDDDELF